MKKKLLSLLVVTAISATLAFTASAHDGWAQTSAPVIAAGETSYVELQYGNHTNEHASYRIVGKWSPDTTKVYVTNPAGKKVEITSTMFYTGELKDDANANINNEYVTQFSASAPGAYIISAEGDSIFKSDTTSSRTLRSSKSFVAVADLPLAARVAGIQGFSQRVNTDRAEMIPLFNPAAVTPGKQVQVQVWLKDKPAANTEVTIVQRSNSDAQKLTTDSEGKVTFTTGAADYYLVRAEPTTDEKVEGQYDSVAYEATMTFTVQNQTTQVAGAAKGVPTIYVNGKITDTKGVSVVNGTTVADAAFIRTYIDPTYQGKATASIRTAAKNAGARVEVLNAVGDQRAAILVYTP